MHYRDGTHALIGDIVRGNSYSGPFVGVVSEISPGPTTCNAHVDVVNVTGTYPRPEGTQGLGPRTQLETWTVTVGECELVHRALDRARKLNSRAWLDAAGVEVEVGECELVHRALDRARKLNSRAWLDAAGVEVEPQSA